MFIDSSTHHPLGFRFEDIMEAMTLAGDEIIRIYREGNFETIKKVDQSPLTRADTAAHAIIDQRLTALTPNIPVISEEGDDPEERYRKRGRYSWVVDPLDGTKEFIGKTGEFTVNVALLDHDKPQCGFVYVPVTGDMYYGLGSGMAFKRDHKGRQIPCQVRTAQQEHFVCLMSRRHDPAAPDLESLIEGLEIKNVGSSLKGCMIAEGLADVYLRLGPTSRWDTAAMQAVIESAGGTMTTLDGNRLLYDRQSIINPEFVVLGHGEIPWQSIIAASR